MSTLKVDNIRHNSATSDAITMASDGTCTAKITGVTGGGALSHRRLNINGSFLVWQRATSVAVSDGSNEGFQAADRMLFKFGGASAGACTVSRSTDVPTRSGFVYSYKIDVTTANSLSTNDHIQNEYTFEGQDILSSGWDYKDPNSYLTISLYLKTNKSGNPKLPLTLRFYDSAGNYRYYTEDITIVGTGWGRYSISIPGDASANDIANNTTDGCTLFICWSTGSALVGTTGTWRSDADRASSNSANFFDSTSNEMYMTGLQFEVGNTMTSYEHRTFADELARCQRYYYRMQNGSSGSYWVGHTSSYGGNNNIMMIHLPVCMRDNPTLGHSGTASHFQLWGNGTVENLSNVPVLRASVGINPSVVAIDITHNITTGHTRILRMGSQAYLEFSAEL